MNPQIELRDEKLRLLEELIYLSGSDYVDPNMPGTNYAYRNNLRKEQIAFLKQQIASLTEQIKAQSDKSIKERIKPFISNEEPVVSRWIREDKESDERGSEVNYMQTRDLTDEEWMKLPKEEILKLYKNCYSELMRILKASQGQPEITDEEVLEPIQNALYATYAFSTDACTGIAVGVLAYLKEAGFKITR